MQKISSCPRYRETPDSKVQKEVEVGNIAQTAKETTVLRDLETLTTKDLLHISPCPSLLMCMS